jgi:hypothetical protein
MYDCLTLELPRLSDANMELWFGGRMVQKCGSFELFSRDVDLRSLMEILTGVARHISRTDAPHVRTRQYLVISIQWGKTLCNLNRMFK